MSRQAIPMLKPRHRRFVDEFLVDLDAQAAYVRAYGNKRGAKVSAHRLRNRPEVAAAIDEAMTARSERTELDQDWVLTRLREVAERSLQARPVLDRKGRPVMVETPAGELAAAFTFDAAGANRSLELLGKHLGMFVERAQVEHRGTIETISRVIVDPQSRYPDRKGLPPAAGA